MLIGLGSALASWRPGGGSESDPLTAARATWVELVGLDVARAAQPVAIERDALVVLTASSSWSAQLVFLEPEIVRGLRASSVTAGITRLRFRVGKIRRSVVPGEGPNGPRRGRGPEPPVVAPAATLDDALARLRRSVERGRARHKAAGGSFCALCEAPLDAHRMRCLPCRDDDERRRTFACERLLFEAPWLSASDVLGLVDGLKPEEFDGIRRRLLRSWWDELARAERLHKLRRPLDRPRLRKLASSFVLLETGMDPMRLEMDSPVRKNALSNLYDFVRDIETAD